MTQLIDQSFWDEFDRRLDAKLEEKLDAKLEEKLNQKFDERFEPFKRETQILLKELQIASAEQSIKITALQLDTAELKSRMGNVEESLENLADHVSIIDQRLGDHIHITEKRLTALEKQA